jgi:hypothetical protein
MKGGNCGGLRSASLHSGPSQRFLRGLRPLVSVGPLPLPESGGGHASTIASSQSVQTKVTDSSKSVSPQNALCGHVDGGGGDS